MHEFHAELASFFLVFEDFSITRLKKVILVKRACVELPWRD